MGFISIGKLKLDDFHYKGLNDKGIKVEANIPLKNNIIFTSIEVNSLSGDLYIVNDKFEITSKDKIGEFICSDFFKLEYNKFNTVKFDLTLYYFDIFFSNIPKISFNIEYEVNINASGKFLFMQLNNIKKRGKINLIKLLKKYLR